MRNDLWQKGLTVVFLILCIQLICYTVPPVATLQGSSKQAGLIGLWHMNFDEDPIRDDSGNNQTGALLSAGNPDYVTGKFGGAYDFDAVGDKITIANDAALSFGNKVNDFPFTFTAWINMDDATEFRILSKGGYGTNNWEYLFFSDVSDHLKIHIFDQSVPAAFPDRMSGNTLTAYQNMWIFVAVTYDGRGGATATTGITLYVNGVATTGDTVNNDASYVAMENDLVNDVQIGAGDETACDGTIDEVAVFNRALSAGEIFKMYHENAKVLIE